MRKNLILISSYLPNTKKEVFYYNEFAKIAPSFKKVVLMYHYEIDGTRNIKEKYSNYIVKYLPSLPDKLLGIRYLFSPIIVDEIYWLLKNRKFSIRKFIIMIGSYASALRIKNKVARVIVEHNLNLEETSVLSYWCNNEAIALSILKKKWPQLRCSTRAHGYDVYEERNKNRYLPFRNFIFDSLDNVLFISNDGLNYSIKKYGTRVAFKEIKVGVEMPVHLTKPKFGEEIVIISCSNLKRVKRVDRIINSLAKIKDKKVRWIHFGDGELREELETQAKNVLKPLDNVTYNFMGEISNAEILKFYLESKVDCFVNMSESEGIPVSVMEAMAYGIPVIATDVGGLSEIVENEENGFLMEEQNIDLNRFIVDIINDRKKFSNAAKFTINSKFNIEKTTLKLTKCLIEE